MVNKNLLKKRGLQGSGRLLLHQAAATKATVRMLDEIQAQITGFTLCHQGRHLLRRRRHGGPRAASRSCSSRRAPRWSRASMAPVRSAGVITARVSGYNKIIDIWANVSEQIANAMMEGFRRTMFRDDARPSRAGVSPEFNPINLMADSGARGSRAAGAPAGRHARPDVQALGRGHRVRRSPTNFREGLSVLQYFISTHGARKGLADTALKTAELGLPDPPAGRRGPGRHHQRRSTAAPSTASTCPPSWSRRAKSSSRLRRPHRRPRQPRSRHLPIRCTGELIIGDRRRPDRPRPWRTPCEAAGIERGEDPFGADLRGAARGVRQAATAATWPRGNGWSTIGEAVGVIAAQSIGEPGTQLTMRTFHYRRYRLARHPSSRSRPSPRGALRRRGQVRGHRAGQHGREDKQGALRRGHQPPARKLLTSSTTRGAIRERYALTYGSQAAACKEGDEVEPGASSW